MNTLKTFLTLSALPVLCFFSIYVYSLISSPEKPNSEINQFAMQMTGNEEITDQIRKISLTLDKITLSGEKHRASTFHHQSAIEKKIALLEEKIRNLESQQTASVSSHNSDESQDFSKRFQRNDEEIIMKETEFGQWMDDSLVMNEIDEERISITSKQTKNILKIVKGVSLDDMKCGNGFCRAKFSDSNGKLPKLDELWGKEPFNKEMYTLFNNEGGTSVYFTYEDIELSEYRKLALADRGE